MLSRTAKTVTTARTVVKAIPPLDWTHLFRPGRPGRPGPTVVIFPKNRGLRALRRAPPNKRTCRKPLRGVLEFYRIGCFSGAVQKTLFLQWPRLGRMHQKRGKIVFPKGMNSFTAPFFSSYNFILFFLFLFIIIIFFVFLPSSVFFLSFFCLFFWFFLVFFLFLPLGQAPHRLTLPLVCFFVVLLLCLLDHNEKVKIIYFPCGTSVFGYLCMTPDHPPPRTNSRRKARREEREKQNKQEKNKIKETGNKKNKNTLFCFVCVLIFVLSKIFLVSFSFSLLPSSSSCSSYYCFTLCPEFLNALKKRQQKTINALKVRGKLDTPWGLRVSRKIHRKGAWPQGKQQKKAKNTFV